MESCSKMLISRKQGECSNPIFQILVYYYYKLSYTGILMVLMVNHIFEASNEFSKQVNGFDFKPYVKNK